MAARAPGSLRRIWSLGAVGERLGSENSSCAGGGVWKSWNLKILEPGNPRIWESGNLKIWNPKKQKSKLIKKCDLCHQTNTLHFRKKSSIFKKWIFCCKECWNIISKDSKVQHWLNEMLILEYDYGSEDFNKLVSNSKFRDMPFFGKASSGKVGFQGDHGEVWYRNIRIKKL